jgi:hypothetical protein
MLGDPPRLRRKKARVSLLRRKMSLKKKKSQQLNLAINLQVLKSKSLPLNQRHLFQLKERKKPTMMKIAVAAVIEVILKIIKLKKLLEEGVYKKFHLLRLLSPLHLLRLCNLARKMIILQMMTTSNPLMQRALEVEAEEEVHLVIKMILHQSRLVLESEVESQRFLGVMMNLNQFRRNLHFQGSMKMATQSREEGVHLRMLMP